MPFVPFLKAAAVGWNIRDMGQIHIRGFQFILAYHFNFARTRNIQSHHDGKM